jgi:twitching motility protein PilT
MDLVPYLRQAVESSASDLIVSAGAPPTFRVNGQLVPAKGPALTGRQTQELVYGILRENQIARFEKERELDFSFELEARRRFRGNAFFQRNTVAAAFRLISELVPQFASLNLPPVLEEFAMAPQGLLLVCGPAGHGKSTTQAAMIDTINTRKRAHIITIEDPIELVHANKKSVIEQREIGEDTLSFAEGLRHVLRESPDVILVGEMRDPESIACALTAAETGHLVIATVHTNDSVQAIDRLIDVFPAGQQAQIRAQMSMSLLAVISQRLIPRANGSGRVPAVEILKNTTGVSHLIRDEKTPQLYAIMETHAREGMRTMDAALKELYLKGMISYEEAKLRMRTPGLLDRA